VLARQNHQQAQRFARDMADDVAAIQADGFTSVRAITDELNRREVPTPRGGQWHIASVHRLLRRLDGLDVKEAA
jgi:hypothetical protein